MTDAPPEPLPSAAAWQRWLLPGDLHEQPTGRRSPRDWIVDLLAFGFAFAVGGIVLGATWSQHGEDARFADVVLGVVALALLWVRRRWPAGVATIVCAFSCVSALAAGPAVVAIFAAIIRAPLRRLPVPLAVAFASAAIFPLLYPTEDSYVLELVIGVLLMSVVMGWAAFARARRDLVLSLRDRARRAEAEQTLRLEHARAAERRRIAGEMHDVLAHRLSLLSLHAGALEYRADASAAEVEQAAGVIREAAHRALEELREVIGVLRAADDPPPTAPPQPTLDRLTDLVAEAQAAAGAPVRLVVAVEAEPPEAVGRTAYRVVQEALTNARKHAPGAAVDVEVRAHPRGDALDVAIRSRRPVGVLADPPPGAGVGLAGLGERVALAGGTLEHGPDEHGDFLVRATLPWTP